MIISQKSKVSNNKRNSVKSKAFKPKKTRKSSTASLNQQKLNRKINALDEKFEKEREKALNKKIKDKKQEHKQLIKNFETL